MSDPFKEIQAKIDKQEEKIVELRKSNKKWRTKHANAEEKLRNAQFNNSEFEQLQIKNGKLLVEINKLKRNNKAHDKLKQIEEIINS